MRFLRYRLDLLWSVEHRGGFLIIPEYRVPHVVVLLLHFAQWTWVAVGMITAGIGRVDAALYILLAVLSIEVLYDQGLKRILGQTPSIADSVGDVYDTLVVSLCLVASLYPWYALVSVLLVALAGKLVLLPLFRGKSWRQTGP